MIDQAPHAAGRGDFQLSPMEKFSTPTTQKIGTMNDHGIR